MATARSTLVEIFEIQRRMADVRHERLEDVGAAVEAAPSVTDWRSQVRNHPWVVLGAAAVAGYLIVPRRRHESAPVATAPAAVAQPVVQAAVAVPEPKRKRGLISTAMGLLTTVAVRAAQHYATGFLEQKIAARPTGAGPTPVGIGLFRGSPLTADGSDQGGRDRPQAHREPTNQGSVS